MKKRILSIGFVVALFVAIGFTLMSNSADAAMHGNRGENPDDCNCPYNGSDCTVLDTVIL